MEISFYGANCLRISTKKAQIVIDDNLKLLGLKSITKPTDISLHTFKGQPSLESRFSADTPGEYEISGMVIHGVAARGAREEEGKHGAVIFVVAADDLRVAVLGHIYPDLSEEQLEQIGKVDIVIAPVGNSGYTMDGAAALKVIKQIEPKVVIPTHYADKAVKYEVPQVEQAEALKNLAMEPAETVAKYRPKPTDLTDTTRLIILQRQ